VDGRDTLNEIFEALRILARECLVIFPVHPRTRIKIESFGLTSLFHVLDGGSNCGGGYARPEPGKINCTMPLGYLDFIRLLAGSRLVLTDSGGIQEETTALKVPCLTLRHNTERPITITEGTNLLAGNGRDAIVAGACSQMQRDFSGIPLPLFWDGLSSSRIIAALLASRERGYNA
jgi:UDP-N-acetylglucosamine 2-epimerase (non-hydrolysing)